MFYKKADKEKIERILSATEGNKIKLLHISSEVSEISQITRKLESLLDQLFNEFSSLRIRVRNIEESLPIPPLKKDNFSLKLPKKKKISNE